MLGGCGFFYPYPTSLELHVEKNLPLASTMAAGSFFTLDNELFSEYAVYVGTSRLSQIQERKLLLGAISLNKQRWAQVWGWKVSNGKYEWFKKWIEVKKLPLSQGNLLQIPTSILKKLQAADESIKIQNQKRAREALSRTDGPLSAQCFSRPLKSLIISKFASPRTLASGRSYYHTGVDMRAAQGTPIFPSGNGEVVLAEKLIVPGNTVIIYHGAGLYSQYKHLSKIEVKPGDFITKKTRLGLSGATGRVEGPHLHWEFYWKGNPVDPLQLLQVWEPICDQS